MSDLDGALDEINRLRTAIARHRDACTNDERSAWLVGYDLELWLTIKET
jgi:hypothetical protein